MSQKVLDALMAAMPHAVVRTGSAHGDETAWIKRDELVAVATWLRDDPKTLFDAPVFCTCIDWLDWKPQGRPPSEAWTETKPRYTVAYQLRSVTHKHRIRLEVELPAEFSRYVVFKGSIAIDGISLTVADVKLATLVVWIIPHTRAVTNLCGRKAGDRVNIEVDLLAKYAEKLLPARER